MSSNVRRITFTAIAAAIVFVATRVTYIPIGTAGAYIHFGDAFIYFTAFLMGGPVAAIAGALGGTICDLSTGYTVYIPATLLIKGLMGLTAGFVMKSRKFWVYILACAIGGAVMTAGYALYEICIPGFGFAYALFNIPFNMGQWGAGIATAAILYPVAVKIQKAIDLMN